MAGRRISTRIRSPLQTVYEAIGDWKKALLFEGSLPEFQITGQIRPKSTWDSPLTMRNMDKMQPKSTFDAPSEYRFPPEFLDQYGRKVEEQERARRSRQFTPYRRVATADRTPVVVGMGAIGPGFRSVDEFSDIIFSGQPGNITEITKFEPHPELKIRIAGEVLPNLTEEGRDGDLEWLTSEIRPANAPDGYNRLIAKSWTRLDDFSKYGILAAVQAMEQVPENARDYSFIQSDARLDEILSEYEGRPIEGMKAVMKAGNNFPVIVGSGYGGVEQAFRANRAYHEGKIRRVAADSIQESMINSASARTAILYQLTGSNYGVSSACASANHAIGAAAEAVRKGADMAVFIASDALEIGSIVASFANVKALTPDYADDPKKASRPWDRDRKGFVLSEGAAAGVLMPKYLAKEKNVPVIAEIAGYGSSSDGSWNLNKLSEPNVRGPYSSMLYALNDAGLLNSEGLASVSYVNAHGTSTPLGDINEAKAISKLLRESSPEMVVGSTKSMTGHLLGATGGLEFIASALSLSRGAAPPNVNLDAIDPEIEATGIRLPTEPYEFSSKIRQPVALTNSFGFGGTNSTVVLRKHEYR